MTPWVASGDKRREMFLESKNSDGRKVASVRAPYVRGVQQAKTDAERELRDIDPEEEPGARPDEPALLDPLGEQIERHDGAR